MMRKFICLLLSVVMCMGAAGVMVGCNNTRNPNGPDGDGPQVDLDPDKQIINISCFTAGYGNEWLTYYLNDYNARHKSSAYQFNRISANTDAVADITNQLQAGAGKAEIYFNDTSDLFQLIRSNTLLDLTDIWNSKPIYESAAGDTVRENIMDADLYEKVYSYNEHIYALPFTQGTSGLIYDHDLFKDKDLLAKDPSTATGLTKGRDGIEGTYDDGLPETTDDFFALCDEIVNGGMVPVALSTVKLEEPAADSLAYQYEGRDNYYATLTYSGTYTKKDGTPKTITPQTGYLAWTELNEGKKFAYDFIGRFELNSKYIYFPENTDHRGCEGNFIYSWRMPNRIAMMFNGTWWQYESRSDFSADERRGGKSMAERDFRIMPLPIDAENTPEDMRTKNVLTTNNDGSVFAVRTEDEAKNAAIKEFLLDYASGGACDFFTDSTECYLAFKNTISDEVQAKLTPYGKNLYEIMQSPNTVIVRRQLIEYLEPYNCLATGTAKPNRWGGRVGTVNATAIGAALRATGTSTSDETAIQAAINTVFEANRTQYNASDWLSAYNSTIGA